jgi:predicted dehydrogenase
MKPHRLITIDPAHFHAALVQKTMLPGVDPVANVYAPAGPDVAAHVQRVAAFNRRADNPTTWSVHVHTGPDFLERALSEPGDVVVLAGRNRDKVRRIHAALLAGKHVLADKPWVLVPDDLPLLAECVRLARERGLVATDILTERYEIASLLQRDLLREPEIVGDLLPGTPDDPGVLFESVHGLTKTVSGSPLRRPLSFFDLDEQGESLTDVGIHLVDLVQWMLRPGQAVGLDEIALLRAHRRSIRLTRDDFERITGTRDYPVWTAGYRDGEELRYPADTHLLYTLGGFHVRLDVRWRRECLHGDTHYARFYGSRASVVILQDAGTGYKPDVLLVPPLGADPAPLGPAVADFVRRWRPGVTVIGPTAANPFYHLHLADALRTGHEEHFAQVAQRFLADLDDPAGVPAWEDAYALARYHVTTRGLALARAS